MFNQNILLIKYSSVYEVYLVSAVTFNLKHTVLYLNRSSSKMPLITSHIYICRCVKIRVRGAQEITTIKSLKSQWRTSVSSVNHRNNGICIN